MTREEPIEKALESHPQKYDNGAPESVTTYNEGYDDGFEVGFREGAAWADANPKRKEKRKCLLDRNKVCDLCHKCDVEQDEYYNNFLR